MSIAIAEISAWPSCVPQLTGPSSVASPSSSLVTALPALDIRDFTTKDGLLVNQEEVVTVKATNDAN